MAVALYTLGVMLFITAGFASVTRGVRTDARMRWTDRQD